MCLHRCSLDTYALAPHPCATSKKIKVTPIVGNVFHSPAWLFASASLACSSSARAADADFLFVLLEGPEYEPNSEYAKPDADDESMRVLPVARCTCGFENGSLALCGLLKALPPG